MSLGAVLLCSLMLAEGAPVHADKIVVNKARRELVLLRQNAVLKTYKVALGGSPVGPKRQQGDQKTPEGLYTISGRNPRSRFHLSLRISYPDDSDRRRARAAGVDPGGDIMIHGLPNGQGHIGPAHLQSDWTEGCIAVTDEQIEEIWRLVPDGTPVELNP